jgi:hypothetical protein
MIDTLVKSVNLQKNPVSYMAYSNFTLAKVYRQFQLKEKRDRLFPELEPVA